MRGLHIVHVVCSDGFAGVEQSILTLALASAHAGHAVTVIGGAAERMRGSLQEGNVQWHAGDTPAAAAVALIRAHSADIVHAHMTEAEVVATILSIGTRVPVVATRHFAQRRGASRVGRQLGRFVTRRTAAQLAISWYVAQTTEGPSAVVIPGTPEVEHIAALAEREPAVLVIQRLETEKRTDLALEAWSHSGLGENGWRLWIAGDGSDRRRLEDLADRLGVRSSCDFLGTRSDAQSLQRRASMVLAPRPDEPLGLSVLEAMAQGTPVIAAAGGGHLETVGRCDNAALYNPLDVAAAGGLIAALAADPKRRSEYGTALRTLHSQHFTVERQLEETVRIYRSVLRP